MSKERTVIDEDVLYEMILEGIQNGFEQFNFTGGEPLYEKKIIISLLKKLAAEGKTPEITIGTNGTMIDDLLLDAMKAYPGKIKFNCSMHAVDEETYLKIISLSQKGIFNHVVGHIQRAVEIEIPVKLNFVLLKGINNSKEYIQKIFDFAIEKRVQTLKFLELLITDKLIYLYDYYYEVDSIAAMFPDDLYLISNEIKRNVYRYKDTDLIIELQKCPCKMGCNTCQQVAGRMLTSDGYYFPCFTLVNNAIKLDQYTQKEAFAKGDQLIKTMGRRYKNGSPLIIQKIQHIKKKKEYYYEVNSTDQNFESWCGVLKNKGANLVMKRTFKEIYFKPQMPNEDWDKNQMIFKVYQNTYNGYKHNHVLAFNKLIEEGGHIYTEVTYLTEKEDARIDDYEEFVKKTFEKKMEITMECNWEINFFEYKGVPFSVGEHLESGMWTLLCEQPFNSEELLGLKSSNVKTNLISFLEKLKLKN
ncbi:molybdenum cofactor biosynthesis protein MoaA [Fusibacter sp. 3D3]|nr:molybdenum cofactor biosynthesis protein MoaA [Fusibacter sp. 3D3]